MFSFFFFNDTATTEIYTLSLHDALPICMWRQLERNTPEKLLGSTFSDTQSCRRQRSAERAFLYTAQRESSSDRPRDRKSTRLNSSHGYISYAVFCLKKKKRQPTPNAPIL